MTYVHVNSFVVFTFTARSGTTEGKGKSEGHRLANHGPTIQTENLCNTQPAFTFSHLSQAAKIQMGKEDDVMMKMFLKAKKD